MAILNPVTLFRDTMRIFEQGYIEKDGTRIPLKLHDAQRRACTVYLPEEIDAIRARTDFPHERGTGRCVIGVENMDSFALAIKRDRSDPQPEKRAGRQETLVLNLANPFRPGGGVLNGARAQEEDLCRRSSLYLSLTSAQAEPYYRYNNKLHSYLSSDAIIITPQVEIIRDERGELLQETAVVAVMTCAAPILRYGMQGLREEEYERLMYGRIEGMLKTAAFHGYRRLVLGAFGCGAFRNDARVVSGIFYRVLREFSYDGLKERDCFDRIDFAVLSRSEEQYNYRQFRSRFENYDRGGNEAERE